MKKILLWGSGVIFCVLVIMVVGITALTMLLSDSLDISEKEIKEYAKEKYEFKIKIKEINKSGDEGANDMDYIALVENEKGEEFNIRYRDGDMVWLIPLPASIKGDDYMSKKNRSYVENKEGYKEMLKELQDENFELLRMEDTTEFAIRLKVTSDVVGVDFYKENLEKIVEKANTLHDFSEGKIERLYIHVEDVEPIEIDTTKRYENTQKIEEEIIEQNGYSIEKEVIQKEFEQNEQFGKELMNEVEKLGFVLREEERTGAEYLEDVLMCEELRTLELCDEYEMSVTFEGPRKELTKEKMFELIKKVQETEMNIDTIRIRNENAFGNIMNVKNIESTNDFLLFGK